MQYYSIFDLVKQSVSLRQAASFYGIHLSRNGKAICPFHPDHHPSLQLYDDHYHCYSCGAHGDVVSLVMDLFHLTPIEAAEKLSEDFGVSRTAATLSQPDGVSPDAGHLLTHPGSVTFTAGESIKPKQLAPAVFPAAADSPADQRRHFYYSYCRYRDKLLHWMRQIVSRAGGAASDAFRAVCFELTMTEQCLDILQPGSFCPGNEVSDFIRNKELEVSVIDAIA